MSKGRTCEECAWEFQGACRRVAWGYVEAYDDSFALKVNAVFGSVMEKDPACPAFVEKDEKKD
jgi:hypothetical protein